MTINTEHDDVRLDVRALTISIESRTSQIIIPAVEAVSFQLRAGTITGLVGESGSGKTLTGSALLGLLPHGIRATGGSVRLFSPSDAQPVEIMSATESELQRLRGKRIAMVFQDPAGVLNPADTIAQCFTETAHARSRTARRAAVEQAEMLLASLGIHDPRHVLQMRPRQLSGGMLQRVVIGLALLQGPDVLIADEPTTALDVSVQADLLDLLTHITEEHHLATLLISHNLGVVQTICNELLVMYAGQVVEHGRTSQVLTAPQHPYTAALVAAAPSISDRRSLTPFDGVPPQPGKAEAGCRFRQRCHVSDQRCGTEPLLLPLNASHLVRCHLVPGPR